MSYLKIGKYYGELEDQPTYQYKETLDVDYQDITNVDVWFDAQNFDNRDFLFCRAGAMLYIAYNGGFSALTEEHKIIASKYFCVSKTDRDTVHTDSEQEIFWLDFVLNSEKTRADRWNKAKSYVSFRLSPADSTDLAVETRVLNEKFVKYGIEDLATDGRDGLFDWLKGEGSFTSNGLPSKSYYTLDLLNGILDRLSGL